MPWTDKPGSSGNSGGGSGPWGKPGNQNGAPGEKRPEGRPAPDLEEIFRSGRERFRRGGSGGNQGGGSGGEVKLPQGPVLGLIIAGIVLLYLATGFYQVSPGARGVVTTFGAFTGQTAPGLNWHMPWPVQDHAVVEVNEDKQVSIGRGQGGRTSMLTSDLNIVDVDMTVNYRIRGDGELAEGELPNAAKFLFNVEDPGGMVKAAAESALREVVGANEFEPIISRGRSIVNDETALILQRILDDYDSGIEIIRVNFGQADPPAEVIPAQRDVIDASSEAERMVNDANGDYNRIVPRAQGEARQVVLDAEAYAAQAVAEARGQASRFNDVYTEYAQAPEVTRERLYLETMERVLGQMNKVVIDDQAGGALPYLNLNELARDGRAGANARPTPQGGQQ